MSTANLVTCSNEYTFFTNEATLPGQVRVSGELMPREQAIALFKGFIAQGITYTKRVLSFNDNPSTDSFSSVGSTLSWRDADNASK